jgi:hypothetical protein
MNYIKHLTGFFEKVAIDKSLNPTHVSLYIALFQFWNCNRFKNPISISRDEVMRISKISSKATYHKCLKNLHSLGYINYEPSYNPFKGSHVYLFNFSDDLKPIQKNERKPKNEPLIEPVSEQALNKSCTSDETSSEQALVPSINYINNTNNLNIENVSNLNEQAKNFQESNNDFVISTIGESVFKEKKLREKKKVFIQPNLQEVKSYFQENNFPEIEAQKFFNYFSSNGWLVGGKTPMVDWQAATQNWILNSINFKDNTTNSSPNRAKHLNTGTDKDYSEPL